MRKSILSTLLIGTSLITANYSSIIESPDASAIIKKDLLAEPQKYSMPSSCNLNDPAAIKRGEYFFHQLNGEETKIDPPDGVSRKLANGKPKQYGNCVACHNIEKAVGAGNIGPNLTNYKSTYIDSGARNVAFVYQKIADPRIDNINTRMTVNLTTKLFNEQEICDLTAYITAKK